MGVTIRCKKTNHNIDMGYIGFSNLRKTVAKTVSPEFGEHYQHLTNGYYFFGEE